MKPNRRAIAWMAGLLALGISWGVSGVSVAQEAAQGIPSVQAVTLTDTEVIVGLDRPIEGAAIGSFFLSDPERLVVDIADAGLGEDPVDISGKSLAVSRVTTEEMEDKGGALLRVTFYLSGPVEQKLQVESDRVRITLRPASSAADPLMEALAASTPSSGTPTAGVTPGYTESGRPLSGPRLSVDAPPTVASLDFENLEDVTRIVIGTNKAFAFEPSQPESNLIVVDLPGATLAPSLERPLDASQFISPVRSVRAWKTSTGTRVSINLRRSTDYTARRVNESLIYVDVKVPDEMKAERDTARQGFTAAAPSTSGTTDGSIRSAYQQELLIGSSGRTVNPQNVFGQGSGVMDPSSAMGMAAGFMFDTYSATDLPYTGQRINVDLVNADIHSVFRLISSVSKLNIVAGDDVTGRVTVRLENVPWDQAFAAVLQAKGLGSQRFGNIVRIAPIETIKEEQQTALEAKRAADDLEDLQVLVLPLNYSQASELETQVRSMLTKRGTLQIDSRSNQLIIQDTQESLAKLRELARQLDKQTPQVLIEARVVEATSKFSRGLGIQWGGDFDASAATGASTGLFFPNSISASGGVDDLTTGKAMFYEKGQENVMVDLGSPVAGGGSIALHLGSMTGLLDLDTRLTAAEYEGWGKIVSSPKVVTLDNREATIKQGARIPYMTTSAAGTQVQFVQAALELNVTPHITSDNRVFLTVQITNDRPDFGAAVNGQPAIQIKEAKTALLVNNGETTVIGGVFATSEAESFGRIPFLSKIPLLGYLFKNSSFVSDRNELLVFITPRIISLPTTGK